MQLILFVGFLLIGGFLNLAKEPKTAFIINIAKAYIIIAILMSISSWLFYCDSIKNSFMQFQMRWVGSLANLVLGYLMGNIILRFTAEQLDTVLLKKIIRLVLWAVTILTGFSFIIESWWMMQNTAKMISFFEQSGYAKWFMYLIMIAEGLGGLGILLHSHLKTGKLAAGGLMLIMIGALYTHCHAHDSFSKSYAAVSEFVTLGILQLIYYFEHILQHGSPGYHVKTDLQVDKS